MFRHCYAINFLLFMFHELEKRRKFWPTKRQFSSKLLANIITVAFFTYHTQTTQVPFIFQVFFNKKIMFTTVQESTFYQLIKKFTRTCHAYFSAISPIISIKLQASLIFYTFNHFNSLILVFVVVLTAFRRFEQIRVIFTKIMFIDMYVWGYDWFRTTVFKWFAY